MELSLKEIETLGRVCAIAFQNEEEKEKFRQELEGMRNYALVLRGPLREFDPFGQDGEEETVWREDQAQEGLAREVLLANAPVTEGDYIAVPRTVEA